MTVGTVAGAVFAAPNIIFRAPLNVIRDYEIEPAVFIVVKPSGAGGPAAFVGDASLCGRVGKGAVAVVVIKDGAAVAGDVEIGVAVVVVVADGDALAVMSFAADAGLFGDVGKCAIAIIVVQGRA